MPAVVLHPMGFPPVLSTFASYGTCAVGEVISAELRQFGVPQHQVPHPDFQGPTEWIIHFINIVPGLYDLVVFTNGMPGMPIPIEVQ
jgi:hypothetical protein